MRIFFVPFFLCFTNFCAFSAEPACWQGFYFNSQLGSGWNKQNARFTNDNYFNTLGATLVGSTFDLKSQGFLGGGGLGYNAQRGCWVLGIESGVLGTTLKKSSPSPFFPELDTFSTKVNWLAFTKLRAGYAYHCFLPFLSGGWTGGVIEMRLYDTPSDITAQTKKWANGWTVGGGCDYKLNRCLSVGLAYDYSQIKYKHEEAECPSCGSGAGFGTPNITNHAYTHAVTVRLNVSL